MCYHRTSNGQRISTERERERERERCSLTFTGPHTGFLAVTERSIVLTEAADLLCVTSFS